MMVFLEKIDYLLMEKFLLFFWAKMQPFCLWNAIICWYRARFTKWNGKNLFCTSFVWQFAKRKTPNKRLIYGKVDGITLVGEGADGIWKSMPGDILVECNDDNNVHHMGIISGTRKTISAASNEIIGNEFGWDSDTVRIFRYE